MTFIVDLNHDLNRFKSIDLNQIHPDYICICAADLYVKHYQLNSLLEYRNNMITILLLVLYIYRIFVFTQVQN